MSPCGFPPKLASYAEHGEELVPEDLFPGFLAGDAGPVPGFETPQKTLHPGESVQIVSLMNAITRRIPQLVAYLALILAPLAASAAAVDYFLKIDGIEGETTAPGHTDEIQIESFSWGVTRARDANSPTLREVQFVGKVNKATPKLFLACASGQHIPEAKLTCRKAGGGSDYYTITFSDLLVSSYQTGGSSGDVVPTDQISLNFTAVKVEYQRQDESGNPIEPPVIGSWPPDPAVSAN
jgi:type VI secretion system secreted protein Hcp